MLLDHCTYNLETAQKYLWSAYAAKLVKMKLKMGEKEELGFVKDFMCCFSKGAPFTHVSKDDMGLVLMNR